MDATWLMTHAFRAALLLGSAFLVVRSLGRARAALRRLVLVLALGGALVSPAIAALVPSWRIATPAAIPSLAMPFSEPPADGAVSTGAPGERAASATAPPARRAGYGLGTVLVALWAFGALAVATRLGHGLVRARWLVRHGAPVDLATWGDAIAIAERETGARARVLVSAGVDVPAVTGLLGSTVLVPPSAEGWTDERRRLVLLHELAHVRQRDCLAHVVAELACAMHWYNPLAWLSARRLKLERELSADDWVLANGARPSSYAEELLAIAGIADPALEAPHGALGMAQTSELGARVVSILAPARARGPVSWPVRALVLAVAAASTVTIACASPDRTDTAELPPRHPATAADSTIVPALQSVAAEELERLVAQWRPTSAAILVLDPRTGEVVADAWRVLGALADPGARKAYIPGSTLKAVTIAAALEEKAITPTQKFDCGPRRYPEGPLRDVGEFATLDATEILTVSSNIGVSRILDELGPRRLRHWLERFHLAVGRDPGNGIDGVRVAIGQGTMATPLQIAAAYGAIANDGVYLAPTFSHRDPGSAGERLVSSETAHRVLAMLEAAVNAERATGRAARIEGVRVAGKTGTAEEADPGAGRYASFVGVVPADAPRFVILVGAETGVDDATGGKVAAPVFARVAARALAH